MENNIPENNKVNNGSGRMRWLILAGFGFLIAGIIALFYLYLTQNRIFIENSSIQATPISLSTPNGGSLQSVLVRSGDEVKANQAVAQIGNDIVKTKDAGLIISTSNEIGKNFAPNEAVITMLRPQDLRVVAQVQEDKGLSQIKIGQEAFFTVDAFGSKKYTGIVDEISPTARSGDVVFNISSARQEQEFNVKIRFNIADYPELKNGMSAKAWIYKD
jgi:multidrug resistance efflux pump